MKKLLITTAVLFIISSIYASTKIVALSPTATASPTPAAQVDNNLQALNNSNIFNGSATKIQFEIKTSYQNDGNGGLYENEFSAKVRQTLFENFTADVFLRFKKPMSNENLPVITELLTAKFQYVNNYIQAVVGRSELTKTISSMNYFGPYCTAGQRYLDLIGFTIPFFLKAGIPELEELDLPPLALSAYYFPTMFNLLHTTYNGSQEYYLFQIRANTNLWENPAQLIINIGKSTTRYFNYSILSGKVAVDTSVSIDLFKHAKINASFAILNTDLTNKTNVVALGTELHELKDWLFVIDDVIFEMQIPLAQVQGQFEPEKYPWFISLRNKISKFRYGFAATTAGNDYTFSTLVSNSPSFAPPFGSGNVYAPDGLTFVKKDGGYPAMYAYIAYEF